MIRLNVNLSASVAEAFKDTCASQQVSYTEGIRRAIALWHLVTQARAQGSKILIQEDGETMRVREVVIL